MASVGGHAAVHVVIPTHTTRHLDACLAAFALESSPPRTIVVSCDNDSAEIAALLDSVWPRVVDAIRGRGSLVPVLLHAHRAHQGRAMLNQVRNNGLRALDAEARLNDSDLVLVLDGDSLVASNTIARHAELARAGYELVIPFRVNLDPATTERITPEAILKSAAGQGAHTIGELAGAADDEALAARHRRYRRQLVLRKLVPGWTRIPKRHKPKILGGHHAVSVRCLRLVNGYDEEYQGYGFDDDDLSRRLYELRPPPRTAIAVRDILAFHLWHPSRAPERPTHAPGYSRFSRERLPTVTTHGWRTPLPQAPLMVRTVGAGQS